MERHDDLGKDISMERSAVCTWDSAESELVEGEGTYGAIGLRAKVHDYKK